MVFKWPDPQCRGKNKARFSTGMGRGKVVERVAGSKAREFTGEFTARIYRKLGCVLGTKLRAGH